MILAVLAGSRHRETVGAEALPDFPGRTQSRSTGNDLPRSAKNLLFVLSMEVALPLAARSMSMLGPVADSGIWAPLLHRINHPTPAGRQNLRGHTPRSQFKLNSRPLVSAGASLNARISGNFAASSPT